MGSLSGDERASGYITALEESNITARPEWVIEATNSVEEGHAAALELLKLAPRPTAIVAVQDLLAIGAMRAAKQLGLHVGQDFAVVGFDDSPVAEFVTPALTSVRQPMGLVGERIVDMLLGQLDEREQLVQREDMVVPELVIRESSAMPFEREGRS